MMHSLCQQALGPEQVAVHWFEQSTYAVRDAADSTILIDPYFPSSRPAEKFIHSTAPHDESTLPVNHVLLTHNHRDHTWPESLGKLHAAFPDIQYWAPWESVENIADNTTIPSEQVHTINAGDSLDLGTMTAHVVYAKPPTGDPERQIEPPDVTHLGFVLEVGAVRLFFSGDMINSYPELTALTEPVAALSPDIGFLTNHPSEGEFPFFEGCVRIAERLGLKHAVPAHYACFVKRDYDPKEWAAGFAESATTPLIIPRNSSVVYP